METTSQTYPRDELEALCRAAVEAAGGSPDTARVLAHATLEAEARGNTAVGLSHLFDYLDGLRSGRIDGNARPEVRRATPSVLVVDGRGGIAQLAFDVAADELVSAARSHGVAMLAVGHTFTCGELGGYARVLAEAGLVSVVVCNSPALMSVGGSPHRVLGTNPLAFAVPVDRQRPILADQASSQTAFVNVRSAAQRHESIPADWAIDEAGDRTQDPTRALAGALLPFGGYKGGNIALLVELLVVLTGASWAVDAAPFDSGSENPDVGMVVIAIDPAALDPQYAGRVASFVDRLTTSYDADLSKVRDPVPVARCDVPAQVIEALCAAAGRPVPGS